MTVPDWRQFPYSVKLVSRFISEIFPQVDAELIRWKQMGQSCPDEVLAKQALLSIDKKKFHAQGGSIYALYPTAPARYTGFIVALQTISDYLDNLCDRVGVLDEQGFRQVHLAMLDALDEERELADYYAFYPHKRDGGYLRSLVVACRSELKKLPSYHVVKKDILQLANLYCDLQTYKHLDKKVRQQALERWAQHHLEENEDLSWWEFSAATGSTLGIFMLAALAADINLNASEAKKVKEAYFPWVCGLHIMLDYFIDQEEDSLEGDLNFVHYYQDKAQCAQRLSVFLENSLAKIKDLNHVNFHYAVVQGLLAMYLSDPKSKSVITKDISKQLLREGGNTARLLHVACCLLRKKKVI